MATNKNEQVQMEAWQKRLDEDFPGGLSIIRVDDLPDEPSSEDEEPTGEKPYSIHVPRVEVLSMASPFSPVVRWLESMGMTSKDTVRTIDTYYVEEEEPTKMVRVTSTDGDIYRFSDNLSEQAKNVFKRKEW